MAKAATRKAITGKAKPTATRKAGYKDHVVGSRKGKMHEAFDKQGSDAAQALGVKLGLKPSTLRTWMATWRRANAKVQAQRN